MPSSSSLLSLATAVSMVNAAAYQGFNYGSTFTNNAPRMQSDFEADFTTAANLAGTNGAFTSARLYTMIQAGTTNSPISAIPAAISTKTSLLLGLWASAGAADFTNEIAALNSSISQYCDGGLADLVAGISIGSEDLYRDTPTGIASNAGPGATAETLVSYITQVRAVIKGTCLANVPLGHVDTWDAWILSSSASVIEAIDWVGMDTYPYFQSTDVNTIANGSYLYNQALETIEAVSQGKEVWTTETGWPVSGSASGLATASLANAQSYWQQVGCPNFGKTNMWWYTLQDSAPTTPNPSFGVVGSTLSDTPLFDLSCQGINATSSSSSAATKATSQAASSSTHSSGSESGSGSGSSSGSKTGGEGSSPAATTGAAPFPSTNGTVAHPSASGTGSVGGPSGSPVSSSSKLNSFGAAAIAFVLAVAAL